MNTLFVLLFFVTFSLVIIGVVRPSRFQKIFSGSKHPKRILRNLGIASFVLFLLIGFTTPEDTKQLNSINTNTDKTEQKQVPKPKITKETITETEEIPFESTTTNDGSLDKGKTKITSQGINGVKTFTYEIVYTDGKQTDKKLLKEEVITAPVRQITAIGTKAATAPRTPTPAPRQPSNCDPNYSPCVPNVSYDLDCPDIGFRVRVIGSDPHRFDREGDGVGCESY